MVGIRWRRGLEGREGKVCCCSYMAWQRGEWKEEDRDDECSDGPTAGA